MSRWGPFRKCCELLLVSQRGGKAGRCFAIHCKSWGQGATPGRRIFRGPAWDSVLSLRDMAGFFATPDGNNKGITSVRRVVTEKCLPPSAITPEGVSGDVVEAVGGAVRLSLFGRADAISP